VLVNKVVPDGPADKAGLKSGDIITAVDGARSRTATIWWMKSPAPPGSSIRLGYERDGKQADTTSHRRQDKVFADMGNQQAEANPDEKGDAARPSWASWSATFRRQPRQAAYLRRDDSVGAVRSFADLLQPA